MPKKKKDMLSLAQDPRYISGIYNYCDRWCERCAFTSRCLTYAMGREDAGDMAARDVENKAFWERLQGIFEETMEMIAEEARERGIDLDEVDAESASDDFSFRLDEASNHELARAARHYADMVDRWFESAQSLFKAGRGELTSALTLGIRSGKMPVGADEISEETEIIRWYQHQIHVKLSRALAQDEFFEGQEEDISLRNDSDGSALVALIAMDRSIGAWGKLYGRFQEEANGILDILVRLDRLRRDTERVFPHARDFKRPGFDEMN